MSSVTSYRSPPSRVELLHLAILEDNARAVRFLLKHGADANARINSPEPLHWLESDPDLEKREIFECTFNATPFGSIIIPSDPIDIPRRSDSCRRVHARRFSETEDEDEIHEPRQIHLASTSPTALHIAAANGKPEIIELLLEAGADPHAVMEKGYTALVVAVLLRRVEAVQLLVAEGAAVNGTDGDGYTPLHYAAKSRHVGIARLLVRHGADPKAASVNGVTALHIAVERGIGPLVEMLLEAGADPNAKTKSGVTALHCAAAKARRPIIGMMLAYGANLDAIVKDGEIDIAPLLWLGEEEKKKTRDFVEKLTLVKPRVVGFYEKFLKGIFDKLARRWAICYSRRFNNGKRRPV